MRVCPSTQLRRITVRRIVGSLLIGLVTCCTVLSAQPATIINAVTGGAVSADLEGREWRVALYSSSPFSKILTWPDYATVHRASAYITFSAGAIKGSGCGQFSGSYHRSGDQLTILARWADDKATPCNDAEKLAASAVLQNLLMVRQIDTEHIYDGLGYNPDALSLKDEMGRSRIVLVPIRTGKDFSELRNTFWHLAQLKGAVADLSHAAIYIEEFRITLSTPSYAVSIPFQYKLSELGFYPANNQEGDDKNSSYAQDRKTANTFEGVLHTASSYHRNGGDLTLFDKDGVPIMVLNPLRENGVEARKWRIAKVRIGGEGLTDTKIPAWVILLNGRVEGSPGCGTFHGTYRLSEDELTIQTSYICAGGWLPEQLAQAAWVDSALKASLRVEGSYDRILLRDKRGIAQILLVPY